MNPEQRDRHLPQHKHIHLLQKKIKDTVLTIKFFMKIKFYTTNSIQVQLPKEFNKPTAKLSTYLYQQNILDISL